MTSSQLYLIILLLSLITGFVPWVLMQVYFKYEIILEKISTIGFISTGITILVGIFYLINWINNIF